MSRQEYDDAFAAKQTAEASLEAARAAEQTAAIDLGYARIYSPLNGIVGFTEAQLEIWSAPVHAACSRPSPRPTRSGSASPFRNRST